MNYCKLWESKMLWENKYFKIVLIEFIPQKGQHTEEYQIKIKNKSNVHTKKRHETFICALIRCKIVIN